LADWHGFLVGKGSTQQHADLSRNRVARLIDLSVLRLILPRSLSADPYTI
jgi:hypothetical protein